MREPLIFQLALNVFFEVPTVRGSGLKFQSFRFSAGSNTPEARVCLVGKNLTAGRIETALRKLAPLFAILSVMLAKRELGFPRQKSFPKVELLKEMDAA